MAKTKNITRKNRKQRGGMEHDIRTKKEDETLNKSIIPLGTKISREDMTPEEIERQKQQEEAEEAAIERERSDSIERNKEARKAAEAEGNSWGLPSLSKFKNPLSGFFGSNQQTTGGNKKQPNPAFGGYLKGGKKHVRNTKKNTKKRTGGNKCNCRCRNCRCSRKDCKCKCADKRFKCTCSSRTCGCKRTLKRRKH